MNCNRVKELRIEMEKNGVSYYLITTDDYHQSEYISPYFQEREYVSGFTGSNGNLLISLTDAWLWTDGRYFLQAEEQLDLEQIHLMKMGIEGVPELTDFLEEHIEAEETLAFDGRCVSAGLGKKLANACASKKASVNAEINLVNAIWENRPALPDEDCWFLADDESGENFQSKLERVRCQMKKEGCELLFINSLDDMMWLFNMRGNDIECNPVVMSYGVVTLSEVILFVRESLWDQVDVLKKSGVLVKEYDQILDYLKTLDLTDKKVWLCENEIGYAVYNILQNAKTIYNSILPTTGMKACKNEVELAKLRDAYLLDSVAVCKFIYWLKKQIGKQEISELSAAAYIDKLRSEIPGYIELSFPTISGYGDHGAVVHYEATEETNYIVQPKGFLLVDSGGQYKGGTTDVTRTIAVGPLTDEEKLCYTDVAIGMLSLANAVFLKGCTGRNLDFLARQRLWKRGLDYLHGTGHGIGYILNVHEGPQSIRWKYIKGADEYELLPGMIISDEPGIYISGKFGIRIENIVAVKAVQSNEYGDFLGFEMLTLVPLEREALVLSELSDQEREMINLYNASVYEKVSPYLTEEEQKWLEEVTASI